MHFSHVISKLMFQGRYQPKYPTQVHLSKLLKKPVDYQDRKQVTN